MYYAKLSVNRTNLYRLGIIHRKLYKNVPYKNVKAEIDENLRMSQECPEAQIQTIRTQSFCIVVIQFT